MGERTRMSRDDTNTREPAVEGGQLLIKLRRLWKGTLFTAIGGVYVALAAVLLIQDGWRTLLLAVFSVGLGQLLRYVANDVDHIGWVLRSKTVEDDAPETRRYQQILLLFLFICIQALNLSLVAWVWFAITWRLSALVFLALSAIELLYFYVRNINRKIEFRPVSYGYSDGFVLPSGPDRTTADDYARRVIRRSLTDKLEILKGMAEREEISMDAYVRVRDEHLIRKVMED